MFRAIAEAAAKRRILVMMACHQSKPGRAWSYPPGGMWYEPTFPESQVLNSWSMLAQGLCDLWNVFAVDLQNEPWAAMWGGGDPSVDWSLGAAKVGNHVLAACPRWLIMVRPPSTEPLPNRPARLYACPGPSLRRPHTEPR